MTSRRFEPARTITGGWSVALETPWEGGGEGEVGNWFNLVLYYGLEAMSLMPMVDDLSMDPEVVRNLCREVKKEICALQCRAFCTM